MPRSHSAAMVSPTPAVSPSTNHRPGLIQHHDRVEQREIQRAPSRAAGAVRLACFAVTTPAPQEITAPGQAQGRSTERVALSSRSYLVGEPRHLTREQSTSGERPSRLPQLLWKASACRRVCVILPIDPGNGRHMRELPEEKNRIEEPGFRGQATAHRRPAHQHWRGAGKGANQDAQTYDA